MHESKLIIINNFVISQLARFIAKYISLNNFSSQKTVLGGSYYNTHFIYEKPEVSKNLEN